MATDVLVVKNADNSGNKIASQTEIKKPQIVVTYLYTHAHICIHTFILLYSSATCVDHVISPVARSTEFQD